MSTTRFLSPRFSRTTRANANANPRHRSAPTFVQKLEGMAWVCVGAFYGSIITLARTRPDLFSAPAQPPATPTPSARDLAAADRALMKALERTEHRLMSNQKLLRALERTAARAS